MRILFIGDIVGRLGRRAVLSLLPGLRKDLKLDAVFANGENLAHGRGATKATIDEVLSGGVDYFTGGNHVLWQPSIIEELTNENLPILRPENYPQGLPGKGSTVIDFGKKGQVLLISLQGRDFINQPVDNPLRVADRVLEDYLGRVLMAVVDFHAEATAEKAALGYYLDGRVSAVLGTHTHVPTADGRVLPGGTAYVTDVGMVGARESVLGVKKENIINRLLSPLPERFEWVDDGPVVFQSVLLEINSVTGKAVGIERVDRFLPRV